MKKENTLLIIFIIAFISLVALLIINNNSTNSYAIESITFEKVKNKIENKESFVIIMTQTTCSNCTEFKPKVNEVIKKYKLENIYYLDYDVYEEDKIDEILDYFDFDGATPTTIFYKDGKQLSKMNRIIGNVDKSTIVSSFKSNNIIKES